MEGAGFDTVETAEQLRAGGLDEARATAIVGTVHRAVSEGVATKEQVSAENAAIKLPATMELAALRADMLKMAIGIVVTNVTIAPMNLIP